MTATRGTDLAVTGTAIIMITITRLAGDLPPLAEFMLLWGGLGCLAAYWTWRWLEFTTPSDGPRFVSLSFAGAWLYSFAGERLQAGIRTGARNHDQSPAQYAADLIRHAAADGRCKLYAREREDGPLRTERLAILFGELLVERGEFSLLLHDYLALACPNAASRTMLRDIAVRTVMRSADAD